MQPMTTTQMLVSAVVVIVSFLLGKYVFPKYHDQIQNAVNQFTLILSYAESFCAYAKQFLTDKTGPEKMDDVVSKLAEFCKQHGIDCDEETLRAIAQKAYNAMKQGEQSNTLTLQAPELTTLASATAELKTFPDGVDRTEPIAGTNETFVSSGDDGSPVESDT